MFSAIFRTFVVGVLPLLKGAVGVFCSLNRLDQETQEGKRKETNKKEIYKIKNERW